MPEVMGATAVTAFVHHHVQPAGGQHWKLFQGLVDEGQVRIDPRRARPQADRWQTGAGEDPLHCSTLYGERPGAGGPGPFLDVEIPLEVARGFRGDRHGRGRRGEVWGALGGSGGAAGEQLRTATGTQKDTGWRCVRAFGRVGPGTWTKSATSEILPPHSGSARCGAWRRC